MYDNSPIVAISTATGKGAIGIVRVSGKDLSTLMMNLFGKKLDNRRVYYLPFKNTENLIIDKGIAIFFKSPKSFTGEDILELQCHGGIVVIHEILNLCIDHGRDIGVRISEPGEFTKRAFLNGRIDLAQAEAIADIIDAVSIEASRSALIALSGEPSRAINALSDDIMKLRVIVEANIDFSEEDIILIEKNKILASLEKTSQNLLTFIKKTKQGITLKNGINVVIAGEPNVGKSSLLNALSEEEVAIVTDIPGTTRDKIINEISINGILINIIDTAGIRESNDYIENIGIKKSLEEIEKADLILLIQDITKPQKPNIIFPNGIPIITVLNKSDIIEKNFCIAKNDDLLISATKKIGLDLLREKILETIGLNKTEESRWISRERHLFCLIDSLEHIQTAITYTLDKNPQIDLIAEELRLSHKNLSKITGQFTTEDILDNIFSKFCIGK
ncbi:tRNA uridine-5-carboxymethylaminomethyl(34) synthesis GTPase MnmE [Candidatus Kinetoplastidibacterium crithidiae]|uniref:tRNA modification GTPase MnmE n=1 Tax=Candidatus Kinetoplastidibacterium crithidiae TCC036E TaxID=1208918 RepID=M1L5X2_9PROT|nr:tRNA uridine-5-carboxymethylaminomethyl(34) synthesis GTPase MnmE [Candidatus Kinetoplastibacterium crithidii]AFZ83025.1 tRNA modification GTPase [Candidatus Kinetoplastibacterium crithidii (ex Angomonas deanei ATCC 30255)]AGF48028.1 tRNA modification GTPase [Candidatus Kinetoplastibacterium crithidii TCC036E]